MGDKYFRTRSGGVYRDKCADNASESEVLVINPRNSGEIKAVQDALKDRGFTVPSIDLERALVEVMDPVEKPSDPARVGAIIQFFSEDGQKQTFIRLNNGSWVGAIRHSSQIVSPAKSSPWWGPKDWSDFPNTLKVLHYGYDGRL